MAFSARAALDDQQKHDPDGGREPIYGQPDDSRGGDLRVLHLHGATKMIEGSPGSPVPLYESMVADDPRVMARLAATEAEDEAATPLIDKRPRKAI